jgi:hypothetical protein
MAANYKQHILSPVKVSFLSFFAATRRLIKMSGIVVAAHILFVLLYR